MLRRNFVQSAAALLASAVPTETLAAALSGTRTTQNDLFAALPAPRVGDWVRLILGSGTPYQKQIGLGVEPGPDGDLLYVETQIGLPGGECNPNTLRRTYLRAHHFGSLLTTYSVLANVSHSGNTLTRWGDVAGGQAQNPHDANLRLLDVNYLYDARPCVVRSVTPAAVRVGGKQHDATHVAVEFEGAPSARARLQRFELWHTPAVPFAVARYRATLYDLDPYELELFSYGSRFKPGLNLSLETIRSMTPQGMSVQS